MSGQFKNFKDIIVIAHDLHAKSEQGLNDVLEYLSEDYDIENHNLNPDETKRRDFYFCKLKPSVSYDVCRCNFCGHDNKVNGCRCHGYTCSGCKKKLYLEYVEGTVISFTFAKQEEMFKDVSLVVHRYDEEKNLLICYPDLYPSTKWAAIKPEAFPAFMELHKDAYTEIEEEGQRYLAIPYERRGNRNSTISMTQVHPHRDGRGYTEINYKEYHIFKGEAIAKGLLSNSLPQPETISIYPTFRHRPKLVTHQAILHAARQVSRIDYYHQDGRPAFGCIQLEWMALYVEHFTDLPADQFRRFLQNCHKDGEGFITGLAQWVSKYTNGEPVIEDEPNVGNFLTAIGKDSLTFGEKKAMLKAFDDPMTRDVCEAFLDNFACEMVKNPIFGKTKAGQ